MRLYEVNFENILQLSSSIEQHKLKRSLESIMFDEYILDDEMKQAIQKHEYRFPDINKIKTDKCILTRSQNAFSARLRQHTAKPYFHKHDFVELLYVYKGSLKQYIDSFENDLELFQGDLLLLNQNVIHAVQQFKADDIIIQVIIPQSYISYQLIDHLRYNQVLFEFFFNAKAKKNEYNHYIVFRNCFSEKIKHCIEDIMTEYYVQDSFYEESMQSFLRLLLIEISRNYGGIENKKHKITQSSVEIADILRYIYEHSVDITLEELSNVFSFNTSYLSRVIRESSNNTFQELLKEFRIEKVEFLLQNSDLSVEQIAQQTGYKNMNSIFKGIRDKYGITPMQYRKFHQFQYDAKTDSN